MRLCLAAQLRSRPAKADGAAIRPQQAVQQIEQRRLAGAVGADDAEDFAWR